MIELKTLRWGNCFSYGDDNYIHLNQSTLTQILGLNGTGKSSIPLIIEEVFFNKNSKGVKKSDIPNRNLGDDYWISIDFTASGKDYFLKVVRKSTVKVQLKENGADISSHTATNTLKTACDLLGMDFKTMSQLFYQSTNASLQFLTATDTNRKRFLIDILNLEDYLKLFEVFKDALKTAALEAAQIEGKIAATQQWLDTNNLPTTDVLPLLNLEINTEEDESLLGQLTAEIQNINSKNSKIMKNENAKRMLESIDISEVSRIEAASIINYDSENQKLGAAKSQITTVKKAIQKLEGLGDQCPTCEQDIAAEFKAALIKEEQISLDQLLSEVQTLEKYISEAVENNKQYNRKVSIQRSWEDAYRGVDKTLPSELVEESAINSQISEIKARLKLARAELQEISLENERRTKQNTKIQIVLEQRDEFKANLETLSAQIDKMNKNLSILETLKKSFSTNGLIAYKIENLVKDLENEVNNYLAELSDGRFTIEFVVSSDKLNVEVTDYGKAVDIMSLSSGELARVNTATLLALRKLMSSMSKSKLNVLFLDEVINVLDEQGKERLVEVLLKEDLNTFIVSHNWTHPLLEKLVVVKDSNGISHIER